MNTLSAMHSGDIRLVFITTAPHPTAMPIVAPVLRPPSCFGVFKLLSPFEVVPLVLLVLELLILGKVLRKVMELTSATSTISKSFVGLPSLSRPNMMNKLVSLTKTAIEYKRSVKQAYAVMVDCAHQNDVNAAQKYPRALSKYAYAMSFLEHSMYSNNPAQLYYDISDFK